MAKQKQKLAKNDTAGLVTAGKGYDSERKFSWNKMGKFLKVVKFNIKKNPWIFAIMVFSTICNAVTQVLLPLIAGNMVEVLLYVKQGSTGDVPASLYFLGMYMHWYSWIFVLIFTLAFTVVFEYLTDYFIGVFAMKVEIQQRLEILDKLVDQDYDFFFKHVSGDILTRLVSDTQGLALGIQMFLSNLIYAITSVVGAAVILFTKNAALAGIAVGYIIGALIIGVILFYFFRESLNRNFDIKREVDTNITDRINNITLIKSSGMELEEIARNEHQNAVYNRAGNAAVRWGTFLNVWIYIANSILPTIMILIAMSMAGSDTTKLITELTVFIPNVSMLSLPIVMMVSTLRAATRATNSADRISQLTDPKPTILPNEHGEKIDHIDSIEFKDITFAYPAEPDELIIPTTNFKFEKGKSYAFVGETGSGKSTIGRLLLRLYDPTSGQVLINGDKDLKTLNLPAYLQNVGYVEQNPQMFYGNFWDNIGYGMFGATHEQIIEAAKKANLHDFIMTLPEQYDTILGEKGFLLSGGQKQRLVIARIFLKDPDLVILDEATSALDNIVEKEIQGELDKLVKGKTSVTIAHRLSTVENADQIIVITPKKGITQVGTFDELKKVPGHFRDLYLAGLMD